jgi:hypothetical protein
VGEVHKCAQIALSGLNDVPQSLQPVIVARSSISDPRFELNKPLPEVVLHVHANFWVDHGLYRWLCKQGLSSDDK